MDQRETYGAESKFSGVNMRPEKLTIVGIDCPDEQRPELADPDRLRLSLDADLVKSIATHGVRVPILIRTFHGDKHTYVVAGRRRVLHAREANKAAGGDTPILIPCVPVERGSDVVASLALENEFRVNSTPLMKARHAARMRDRGHDDGYIANIFGVSRSALKLWWNLLDAPPAVQKAVESGVITATVAAEIAKFEPAKQADALAQAIADGRGSATLENVRALRKPRSSNDHERPRRLGLAAQRRFAEVLGESEADEAAAIALQTVRAILGEGAPALKGYPSIAKAFRRATRAEGAGE